ncbi:conserved hypothetical protein [Perkinsus marinus ATCC 50983]|uniref:Reverse transcriptase domain-containing protein n=1 Tax=Perkinsus marinus (strain ATCC 50983 / TXsc) TaxID=423536 RepID=C5L2Z0_PERM5|nr:conserved hypothetical protein [Perkinsus marinus ATCC 50983]EER08877.1 conserved hypothetical protein [Perkinsus marinus ATCC 50983]|eukprot:XP_002777061.1 conserved hypothetical protein [Perkinsus marinus ATCC 50983]
MVCLQEPCSASRKLVGYQYHGLRKNEEACILSKRGIPCHTVFASRDLVVVKGNNYGIASWYFHGTDMPRRELALSELDQVLSTWPVSVPLYICVDANAWHIAWGSELTASNLRLPCQGITDSLSTLVKQFTPEAPAPSDTTWWTGELSRLKAKLKRAQRTFYRHKRLNGPDAPSTAHYREIRDVARRKFCAAVEEAKGAAARRFFEDLQHYSRCVKRGCPRIPPAAICPHGVNQADFLLRKLFPRDPERAAEVDALVLPPQADPIPAVTYSELREAADGLRRSAAPGKDDVTNGIILDTLEVLKDNWCTQFTEALETGIYPDGWKSSKGIFIHKTGRDPTKPNGWRPICLVGSGSKLFERLIIERLASCPQIQKRLDSPIVHGFCKGKSVDSAVLRVVEAFRAGRKRSKSAPIALVQLDVQNAFSSVKHSHILATLAQYDVPRYLVSIVEGYLRAQSVSAVYGADVATLNFNEGCLRAVPWAPSCSFYPPCRL